MSERRPHVQVPGGQDPEGTVAASTKPAHSPGPGQDEGGREGGGRLLLGA